MALDTTERSFTQDQIDKIGNSIIYFSKELNPGLNKTKILKLLFLLEESCIKNYCYPFFGIDFQLWKYGPVAKDIYIDLSESAPTLLKDYVKPNGKGDFKAIKPFNDDEFSDNDIELLKDITVYAKNKNAKYLVNATHQKGKLWRKSAIKHGVLDLLENEQINSTEKIIDFTLLFERDSDAKENYLEFSESMAFIRHLKSE